MSRIKFSHTYDSIISLENLLEAWGEFVRGKRARKDVQEFEVNLMENIISLHNDLKTKTYTHAPYHAFNISDPKPRNIHKASVRDRLLHHALYRQLYPFFGRTFIADSYSCRLNKGTHKAINRFRTFAYKVSQNHTRTVWILKCDIRKFFASVNQDILISILKTYISDKDILWLPERVIGSFQSTAPGVGLPLGNFTSQLFVNIYMNEFDQFMKHRLKAKYYIRYADDFVILSRDKSWLEELLPKIGDFLEERLKLDLHPNKVSISTLASGVDFLGWVHFPDHRVLRTVTKRRMMKRISENSNSATLASYLVLTQYGNTNRLREKIRESVPSV
ncbi:MAG: reverse transcriptase domain-containing protein [Patescibacteria group bacterium]